MKTNRDQPSYSSQAAKKPLPPVSIRLTAEERERLVQLSEGSSLSGYIRKSLFGAEAKPRKTRSRVAVADEIALAKVLGLLGKSEIASSLRTLAQHADHGSLMLDNDTMSKIDEAYRHINSMRSSLISALGLIEKSKS